MVSVPCCVLEQEIRLNCLKAREKERKGKSVLAFCKPWRRKDSHVNARGHVS